MPESRKTQDDLNRTITGAVWPTLRSYMLGLRIPQSRPGRANLILVFKWLGSGQAAIGSAPLLHLS